MIKPVTFQGLDNFDASLYALELKSRFTDQKNANGYYLGRGDELEGTVVGNTIQIGTGAFLVQGRMSEITEAETLSFTITNGYVGYVCIRIETYHPSDEDNTSLVVYTGQSFEEIEANLRQDDTYEAQSDDANLIYELPIYSFEMSTSGAVTNLTRLIQPIEEFEKMYKDVTEAVQNSIDALDSAEHSAQKVEELEERIVTSEGTGFYISGTPIAEIDLDGTISDEEVVVYLDCGNA